MSPRRLDCGGWDPPLDATSMHFSICLVAGRQKSRPRGAALKTGGSWSKPPSPLSRPPLDLTLRTDCRSSLPTSRDAREDARQPPAVLLSSIAVCCLEQSFLFLLWHPTTRPGKQKAATPHLGVTAGDHYYMAWSWLSTPFPQGGSIRRDDQQPVESLSTRQVSASRSSES